MHINYIIEYIVVQFINIIIVHVDNVAEHNFRVVGFIKKNIIKEI